VVSGSVILVGRFERGPGRYLIERGLIHVNML
jgi:hypothetical protein